MATTRTPHTIIHFITVRCIHSNSKWKICEHNVPGRGEVMAKKVRLKCRKWSMSVVGGKLRMRLCRQLAILKNFFKIINECVQLLIKVMTTMQINCIYRRLVIHGIDPTDLQVAYTVYHHSMLWPMHRIDWIIHYYLSTIYVIYTYTLYIHNTMENCLQWDREWEIKMENNDKQLIWRGLLSIPPEFVYLFFPFNDRSRRRYSTALNILNQCWLLASLCAQYDASIVVCGGWFFIFPTEKKKSSHCLLPLYSVHVALMAARCDVLRQPSRTPSSTTTTTTMAALYFGSGIRHAI